MAPGIGTATPERDATWKVSNTPTASTKIYNKSGNGASGTLPNQKYLNTHNMWPIGSTFDQTFNSQRVSLLHISMSQQIHGPLLPIKVTPSPHVLLCLQQGVYRQPMCLSSMGPIRLPATCITRANGPMKESISRERQLQLSAQVHLPFKVFPLLRIKPNTSRCFNAQRHIPFPPVMIQSTTTT